MNSIPLLLLAAAGVGIAHSILPDHWVPLAVIARANRWTLPRTAKISFLAGLGHVAVSLILGILLAAVGLALRQTVIAEEGRIVGGVLVLTGLGFLGWAIATRGKGHGHTHSHPHVHGLSDAAGHGGHDHAGHTDEHDSSDHDHAVHDHPHADGDFANGHTHGGHDHGHDHGHDDHGHEHAPPRRGWLAEIAVPFGVAASPDLTILPVFLAASTVGAAAAVGTLVTFAIATLATFVILTVVATVGGYQVNWPWLDANGHMVSALVLLVIGVLVFLQV